MASDIMANCDIGSWKTLPHSDVGIKNLSPNGGLNASLQLLLHTPSFIALVLTAHDTCNQVCLWCTIRNIISDMKNKRRGYVLSISEDFLSSFFGGFGGEPLPYLEKIFCHLTHNLRDKKPQVRSISIMEVLHGTFERKMRCSMCGTETSRSLLKVGLDVPLLDNEVTSCQEAVTCNLSASYIEDEWCSECSFCTEHNIFASSYISFPPMLCLKFSRFSNEGVKRTSSVHLDMNLQLPSGASYKFAGCILHEGESRAAGQYMSLVRCPSGSFTLLNDAQVKAVRRESLFSRQISS